MSSTTLSHLPLSGGKDAIRGLSLILLDRHRVPSVADSDLECPMAEPVHCSPSVLVAAQDAMYRSQQEMSGLQEAVKSLGELAGLRNLPRELNLPESGSHELSRCLDAFFETPFPALTNLMAEGLAFRLGECQRDLDSALARLNQRR
jgi:hypothetical protein